MIYCRFCLTQPTLDRGRDCKDCQTLRKRAEEREKESIRRSTRHMIRKGRMLKGPCALCGSTDSVQAHHRDYDDPEHIWWLCPSCHRREHAALRKTGRSLIRKTRKAHFSETYPAERVSRETPNPLRVQSW